MEEQLKPRTWSRLAGMTASPFIRGFYSFFQRPALRIGGRQTTVVTDSALEAHAAALNPEGGTVQVTGHLLEYIRNHTASRRTRRQLLTEVRQKLTAHLAANEGKCSMFRHSLVQFVRYGGNVLNPSDWFSTGTWLLGKSYLRGEAHILVCFCKQQREDSPYKAVAVIHWSIDDFLDVMPNPVPGRDTPYNWAARNFVAPFWHEGIGGRTDVPVEVRWREVIDLGP
jgi:hypothetical protein